MEQELLQKRDAKYAEFQRKLIPTVIPESIIGIRTPDLKKYAKDHDVEIPKDVKKKIDIIELLL